MIEYSIIYFTIGFVLALSMPTLASIIGEERKLSVKFVTVFTVLWLPMLLTAIYILISEKDIY